MPRKKQWLLSYEEEEDDCYMEEEKNRALCSLGEEHMPEEIRERSMSEVHMGQMWEMMYVYFQKRMTEEEN